MHGRELDSTTPGRKFEKKKKNQKKQGLGWYEAAENYVSMF